MFFMFFIVVLMLIVRNHIVDYSFIIRFLNKILWIPVIKRIKNKNFLFLFSNFLSISYPVYPLNPVQSCSNL